MFADDDCIVANELAFQTFLMLEPLDSHPELAKLQLNLTF